MVVADKVIIELQAKLDQYNANVIKAQNNFERSMSRIQRSAVTAERRIASTSSGIASSLTKAFAVAGGARSFQLLVDSATRVDNALKVAGLSGQELERVYGRLRDSAIRNAAPLETLVTLYGRAALVQNELNVSQEEMLNFTDKIALALRVSGQSAAESSGALLQLSQALGSGVVRAEEFNSILEGALPIAQAAAKGLKEAGGSVAKLRQLVVDGKISSEAFFRAFEAGADILEDKVAGATLTTEQGLTNIGTALIDAAREFAKGSLAAETFGEILGDMAAYINGLDFEAFGAQVRELIGLINSAVAAVNTLPSLGQKLGQKLGTDAVGDFLTGGSAYQSFLGGAITITNQRGVQRRIDDAFSQTIEGYGELTAETIKGWYNGASSVQLPGSAPTPTLRPTTKGTVSLDDFNPPPGRGSGRGGSGARGGRGGGSRADEYERLSQRIRESAEALNAETDALSRLNPLVNDYGFSVEKARAEQELLSAAQKAGLAITPELEANITMLATAYANAEASAAKLRERQEGIIEAAGFVKDTVGDMVSDMIPAIETGNAALDKFLNTLIEAVAQATLLGKGPLAGIFGGGGGFFSLFGFAQGGTAAGGRPQPMKTFARGGVSRTAAIFGEAGPEAAVPLPDGRRIPVDLRMPEKAGGQQNVHVTVGVSVDENGTLMPFVQSVAQSAADRSTAALGRNIPKMVDQRVNTRQTRGTRP